MKIRDCPAAVSGNERHHQALTRKSWEAMASRKRRAVIGELNVRKSEDLPATERVGADFVF